MDWDTVVDKAIDYLSDNNDVLIDCVDELDRYTDIKEDHMDDDYFHMSSFDEYFYGTRSILEDIIDNLDSDFSSGDEYFYFDGYGSICSTSDPEYNYDDMLDEDLIQELYDNDYRISLPDYIQKLFEAFDEDEEDEDELEEDEEDEKEEGTDKE